jgi:hypothetical protein
MGCHNAHVGHLFLNFPLVGVSGAPDAYAAAARSCIGEQIASSLRKWLARRLPLHSPTPGLQRKHAYDHLHTVQQSMISLLAHACCWINSSFRRSRASSRARAPRSPSSIRLCFKGKFTLVAVIMGLSSARLDDGAGENMMRHLLQRSAEHQDFLLLLFARSGPTSPRKRGEVTQVQEPSNLNDTLSLAR